MGRDRIDAARDELHRMLNEDELRECIHLVFANKQDLPNAMSAAEMTDKLGLNSLRHRQWYIQRAARRRATACTRASTGSLRRSPRRSKRAEVRVASEPRAQRALVVGWMHGAARSCCR